MTRDNYDADIITASPFAPAEMYLSDMIGKKNNNGENFEEFLVINVSNYLIFSPPSTDPLSMIDLQGSVIDLLSSLKISSNTGDLDLFSIT